MTNCQLYMFLLLRIVASKDQYTWVVAAVYEKKPDFFWGHQWHSGKQRS